MAVQNRRSTYQVEIALSFNSKNVRFWGDQIDNWFEIDQAIQDSEMIVIELLV